MTDGDPGNNRDGGELASRVKRRRRWLFAYGALALATVISVAAVQTFGDSKAERQRASKLNEPARPVIVERIELKPVSGARGHGLAELVRKDGVDSLRVLAVRLKPSLVSQSYQLVLAGGGQDATPLGGQVVGRKGAFLGQARITVAELQKFRRVELRRITEGTPPDDELVLRGSIPR